MIAGQGQACYTACMNAPFPHRSVLRWHVAAVEAKHPIRIIGLLPRGSVGHVFAEDAVELLAEKREGLDLFGLAQAERDLSDLIGWEVGVVLVSGLKGREAVEFPAIVEPL